MWGSASLSRPKLSQPSDHIMAVYIGNTWSPKAESSHSIWFLPSQGMEINQHAFHLQLLTPLSCWIEALVWKQPNTTIFRYFQSYVATVFFPGLSLPRYSTPQKLADPSHNRSVVPVLHLSLCALYFRRLLFVDWVHEILVWAFVQLFGAV